MRYSFKTPKLSLFMSKNEFLDLITSFGLSQFIVAISTYLRAFLFFPQTNTNALASWFFWQLLFSLAGFTVGHRVNASRISTLETGVGTKLKSSKGFNYLALTSMFLIAFIICISPKNTYVSAIIYGFIPFALYVVFLRKTSWFIGYSLGRNQISKLNYLNMSNSLLSLLLTLLMVNAPKWGSLNSDFQSFLMNSTLLFGSTGLIFIYFLKNQSRVAKKYITSNMKEVIIENSALFPPSYVSSLSAISILVFLEPSSMVIFGLYSKLAILLNLVSGAMTSKIINTLHVDMLRRNRIKLTSSILLLNIPLILFLSYFHEQLIAILSNDQVSADWSLFYLLVLISLINVIWIVELGSILHNSKFRKHFGMFVLKFIAPAAGLLYGISVAVIGVEGVYLATLITYSTLILVINLRIRTNKV